MGATDKLYVVVDGSLAPGLQIAQALHAFREFLAAHPEAEARWYGGSNTLAVLAADGERALHDLLRVATRHQIRAAAFREPDLAAGGTAPVTAVALEPGDLAARLCRGYPLALSARAARLAS